MSFTVDNGIHDHIFNAVTPTHDTGLITQWSYEGSSYNQRWSIAPGTSGKPVGWPFARTWAPVQDGDWFQWKCQAPEHLRPVCDMFIVECIAFSVIDIIHFKLAGSDTGSFSGEEVTLFEVEDYHGFPYNTAAVRVFRFDNSQKFRYLRFIVTDIESGDHDAIDANINFYARGVRMTNTHEDFYCGGSWAADLFTGGTPNTHQTSGVIANAFDDNAGTAFTTSASKLHNWIGYDLGAGNEAAANRLTWEIGLTMRAVSRLAVFGTNGASTFDDGNEAIVAIIDGITGWVANTKKTFDFENDTDYRYYRVYFTGEYADWNGDSVDEAEIYHCTEILHSDIDPILEEETLLFEAFETFDLDVDSLTFDETESLIYTEFMGYTENLDGVEFEEAETLTFDLFVPSVEIADPFIETDSLDYYAIAFAFVDFASTPFVETESFAETDEGITAYGAPFEEIESLEYSATVLLESEPFTETESLIYNFTEQADSGPFAETEELYYTAAITQAMPAFVETESLEYTPVQTGQITADNDLPFIELETRFGMLADNDLPFVELEAQLQPFHTITASQDLPFIDLEATLLAGKLITADNDLPFIEVSGQIVNTNVLSCSQDLPFVELDAMIATQNIITADNDLPFFDIRAMITGSQTRFAPATAVLKHTRW